jgi:inorganic pyrophosphatase
VSKPAEAPQSLVPPFAKDGTANVIIDTPKGSRNKYKFDPERQLLVLAKLLPAGAVFPFDFGYIPGTKSEDGDPLDVLVLMDEPAFAGCLVSVRLIGVIEATQKSVDGMVERNDRLIGVAAVSPVHREVRELENVNSALLDEIEHFFTSYNAAAGRKFMPEKRGGSRRALEIVEASHE